MLNDSVRRKVAVLVKEVARWSRYCDVLDVSQFGVNILHELCILEVGCRFASSGGELCNRAKGSGMRARFYEYKI